MRSVKKYAAALIAFCILTNYVWGQDKGALYLFHWNPFSDLEPKTPKIKRTVKVRLEAGLLFGYYGNDPHYTNSTQSQGGDELGLKAEIPLPKLHKASILVGCNYYTQGLSFNSYFFGAGNSFLYIPSEEIYNHTISFSELHFPVEYKISFSPENTHPRTFYALFGWVYRLMLSDNTLVTNTATGRFVYEGQDDMKYNYSFFTNKGSCIIELALGYQRNILKNGDAFFLELTYDYGISAINYSGNTFGSNDINFTANTLCLKLGLRL